VRATDGCNARAAPPPTHPTAMCARACVCACARVCMGARASPPSVWVLHAHKPPLLGGCMIGAPAAHVISLLLDLPDHARATPPGQPPPPLPPRPHPHHMTQHKNTGSRGVEDAMGSLKDVQDSATRVRPTPPRCARAQPWMLLGAALPFLGRWRVVVLRRRCVAKPAGNTTPCVRVHAAR
jgi:hypothetical protein